MNWITTNIRLPEDMYMELKMEAAASRKSMAEIVRERIRGKKDITNKKKTDNMLMRLEKLAKKIAKQNKGINFTKGLIEMRYEQ